MSSKITEQDFKDLLIAPVGSLVGTLIKIEDSERVVFPGTVKRTISWQEGNRFFSHKTMTTGRQGQKPTPVFDYKNIQEVFPIEVKNTIFLTEAEIKLRTLYDTDALA